MLGERVTGKFYDHVMIDNVAAARLLTEHLLELGHRRIAILPVSDVTRNSLHLMRYQGYLDALRAADIQPDPELIVSTQWPVLLTHHSGMTGMEQLLARGHLPDAVFCLNDLAALGALKTLSQHGYHVPEDIAVVGFDDIAESYLMSPALTTISPDKKAIGQMAVSLLIDRINGKRTGPPELVNPEFKLVVRESTVGRSIHPEKEV
jgi:DNA-binding LacI/PurR family transcriptional regulator